MLHSWLKDQFRKADKNGSGWLDLPECAALLDQLNIQIKSDHLKQLVKVCPFHFSKWGLEL